MFKKIYSLALLACMALPAIAQKLSFDEQVKIYIEQYKEFAIIEQMRSGVPASITLAQGVFETGAGSSELCNNAQNHFGIKCKNTWIGETYLHTDDAKDECFRKYESALVSYKDHSDFLKANKRYAPLFQLSPTDYSGWAHGLKKCGYATNPKYAAKLIELIENYKLQDYTHAALGRARDGNVMLAAANVPKVAGENVPENDTRMDATLAASRHNSSGNEWEIIRTDNPVAQEQSSGNIVFYEAIRNNNGLRGFYARKGDMLLEYAIKNKVRYSKLLEMNDLPDAPLEADMFVYLEKKRKTAQNPTHVVEEGETMLQISQQEGIQLAQLKALNRINNDEQPMPGSTLNLQTAADEKPNIYTGDIRKSEEQVGFGYGGARPSKQVTDASSDWIDVKKNTTAVKERVIEEEDNIAELAAVEEEAPRALAQAPQKKENVSELDKLKAKMDRSVYNGGEQVKETIAVEEEEDEEDYEDVTTVPAHVQSEINKDPEAALRKHMKQSDDDGFRPKRNANHQQMVREQVTPRKAAPVAKKSKTSAKSKVAAKGKSTKGKAAVKGKSTAKGKTAAKAKTTTSKSKSGAAKKAAPAKKKKK